jgi:hypothetical protein
MNLRRPVEACLQYGAESEELTCHSIETASKSHAQE